MYSTALERLHDELALLGQRLDRFQKLSSLVNSRGSEQNLSPQELNALNIAISTGEETIATRIESTLAAGWMSPLDRLQATFKLEPIETRLLVMLCAPHTEWHFNEFFKNKLQIKGVEELTVGLAINVLTMDAEEKLRLLKLVQPQNTLSRYRLIRTEPISQGLMLCNIKVSPEIPLFLLGLEDVFARFEPFIGEPTPSPSDENLSNDWLDAVVLALNTDSIQRIALVTADPATSASPISQKRAQSGGGLLELRLDLVEAGSEALAAVLADGLRVAHMCNKIPIIYGLMSVQNSRTALEIKRISTYLRHYEGRLMLAGECMPEWLIQTGIEFSMVELHG